MSKQKIDTENAKMFLRVQRENMEMERKNPITLDEFPALWRKVKEDADKYPYPRTREQDYKLFQDNRRFASKHQYFYYQTVHYKITSAYIEEMIDLKCNKAPTLTREEIMALADDINRRHGVIG